MRTNDPEGAASARWPWQLARRRRRRRRGNPLDTSIAATGATSRSRGWGRALMSLSVPYVNRNHCCALHFEFQTARFPDAAFQLLGPPPSGGFTASNFTYFLSRCLSFYFKCFYKKDTVGSFFTGIIIIIICCNCKRCVKHAS